MLGLDKVSRRRWVFARHRTRAGSAPAGQAFQAQAGLDGRPAVFALEFAGLPLAGQQPERVVQAGLQTQVDIVQAGERFQASPKRDRWHIIAIAREKLVDRVSPDRFGLK